MTMLLADHLALRGHLPAGSPASSSFSAIRAFLFGEEYTVELTLDGNVTSYRFDTLGEALDVLRGEFERDDRFIPEIGIIDYSKTRDPGFGIVNLASGERPGYNPRHMTKDQITAMMAGTAAQVPTFGPAPTRVLAVTRAERNEAFPRPPMEFYVEDIEKAVTFFSISGTWDQMDGRSNI
jgi:hypothetical protein